MKNLKKYTKKTMTDYLGDHGVFADQVVKNKDGNFIVRFGFYYKMGKTTQIYINKIFKAFDNQVTIIDSGEIWKAFKGGASIKAQSHFFVTFSPILKKD